MSLRKISADEMERLLVALAVHFLIERGGYAVVPAVALETAANVAVTGDDNGVLTFTVQEN